MEIYSFITSKRRLKDQMQHISSKYYSCGYKYKFAQLAYEYFMDKFK